MGVLGEEAGGPEGWRREVQLQSEWNFEFGSKPALLEIEWIWFKSNVFRSRFKSQFKLKIGMFGDSNQNLFI